MGGTRIRAGARGAGWVARIGAPRGWELGARRPDGWHADGSGAGWVARGWARGAGWVAQVARIGRARTENVELAGSEITGARFKECKKMTLDLCSLTVKILCIYVDV